MVLVVTCDSMFVSILIITRKIHSTASQTHLLLLQHYHNCIDIPMASALHCHQSMVWIYRCGWRKRCFAYFSFNLSGRLICAQGSKQLSRAIECEIVNWQRSIENLCVKFSRHDANCFIVSLHDKCGKQFPNYKQKSFINSPYMNVNIGLTRLGSMYSKYYVIIWTKINTT